MIDLSRRNVLTGTMAASAAALLPVAAQAAAPPSGKQAAGFYRYKLGDVEVTVVTDGANRQPVTDAFVINVKKEDVNAALAAAYMEPGFFVGPYNPIVLNTGSKLAL